ncbi:MAG: Acetyltransferase (GNAT) family protein [Planctomycetes bacterium ADurb.Bin401]|nr:MAG: Acetyltransferase (GNAT) family protein [Planctomycetes bacterium ADurb.Bin401]
MQINIRKAAAADQSVVMDIIVRTNFFRPVELDIAREVFEDAVLLKPGCTYQSYIAESESKTIGWVCFGVTPCTIGTFDIYWIAVDPAYQKQHIGSQLLTFAEKEIALQEGRLSVIETSGSEKYISTQQFYIKNGYRQAACINDFYAPGDPKLVFTKKIG